MGVGRQAMGSKGKRKKKGTALAGATQEGYGLTELPAALEEALRAVESACSAASWQSCDDVELLGTATKLAHRMDALQSVMAVTLPRELLEWRVVQTDDQVAESRRRLWDWASSCGSNRHEQTCLSTWVAREAGVFARGEIGAGEVVFSIPILRSRLILFAAYGCNDDLAKFATESGLEQMSPTVALALRLVHEAQLGEGSQYKAYVGSLPAEFDTPLSWDCESLALLAGATLRKACAAKRSASRTFCELIRAIAGRSLLRRSLARGCITWDEWLWAMGAVVTRQNALPISSDTSKLCLVPLWDCCNHALDAPASEVRQDLLSGQMLLELRTDRHLKAGDQMWMRYGARSDADLVLHSGFLLGNRNPHDALKLHASLPTREIFKLLAALLDAAGVTSLSSSEFGRAWLGNLVRSGIDSVSPDPSLCALALAAVADKIRAAHLIRTSNTDHTSWRALDAHHQRDADTFLTQLCDRHLAARAAFRVRMFSILCRLTSVSQAYVLASVRNRGGFRDDRATVRTLSLIDRKSLFARSAMTVSRLPYTTRRRKCYMMPFVVWARSYQTHIWSRIATRIAPSATPMRQVLQSKTKSRRKRLRRHARRLQLYLDYLKESSEGSTLSTSVPSASRTALSRDAQGRLTAEASYEPIVEPHKTCLLIRKPCVTNGAYRARLL